MDDEATRVISSILTMYDIMERRITLVESLVKARQPFKDMDVVYIISPTVASIKIVCSDFENSANYKNVHLFFLDTVCFTEFVYSQFLIRINLCF